MIVCNRRLFRSNSDYIIYWLELSNGCKMYNEKPKNVEVLYLQHYQKNAFSFGPEWMK